MTQSIQDFTHLLKSEVMLQFGQHRATPLNQIVEYYRSQIQQKKEWSPTEKERCLRHLQQAYKAVQFELSGQDLQETNDVEEACLHSKM